MWLRVTTVWDLCLDQFLWTPIFNGPYVTQLICPHPHESVIVSQVPQSTYFPHPKSPSPFITHYLRSPVQAFGSPSWHHEMKIFSALLALCVGNSPVTGEFFSQRPVTQNFDVFFDLRPNKSLRNNRKAGDLRRHRAYYDFTLIPQVPESYISQSFSQCLFSRRKFLIQVFLSPCVLPNDII